MEDKVISETTDLNVCGYNLEVTFDAFIRVNGYEKETRYDPACVDYSVEVEIKEMYFIGESELISCKFSKDFEKMIADCIEDQVRAGEYF